MSKSSTAHKNLHVTVVEAKELVARKGNLYGEAIVLDTRGEKLGRSRSTRPVRISPSAADPQWDALLAFQVEAKAFSGLMVRLWDKHTFRRDGFLGQVTIKFNTELLDAGDEAPIDQWFALKQRGKKEDVSGSVHLRIHYGDHRAKGKAKGKPARHGEDDGVEEEGDDEEEAKQRPLALSSHYHKDDPRLKKSTFVQVDEDDEDEDYEAHDGLEVAYEPARKGKAELAKLHKDAKATLSAKNFEAANPSSYSAEAVKGLVGVNAGRWYYEVKMISYGQVMVGWCTSSYSKDGQGDAWTFDATNAQTMRKGSYHASFGTRCSQNEVIGVGIDVKAKTISYWRNGTALGEAWTDAALSNKYDRFHPLIDLGRGAHVKVNFGRDPFVHPQTKAGYYALHCALSDSELGALAKLFDEYKAAGIDLTNSADAGDAIQGNGTIKLGEDLGAVDDDDPLMMVLAWKLDCEEKWTISRQEWMDGFALHGCHTLWRIAELAQQWKREVKANAEQFQSFYNFMYPYLLGGGETNKKILEFDVVELVWEVLVKPRGWGLYDEWLAFHREKGTKAVTKDAFQQLYEFMVLYPRDLTDYDESAAWPLIFDEFVEWYRAKHPQPE